MPQKFNQADLDKAIGKLRLLRMNPLSDPGVASALMEELAAMCPDKEALEWLASRAIKVYRDWQGVLELRALLCSRYRPADGVEVYSSVFPDAIPLEQSAEVPPLALPPGHTASADLKIEGMVADLAKRKMLPKPGQMVVVPKTGTRDAVLVPQSRKR